MNRTLLKTALSASFLILLVIGLNSCRKEQPTTATISVIDTAGAVVEFANVQLFPVPTVDDEGEAVNEGELSTIWDTVLVTDFEGKVTFDYTEQFNLGQAGFAVLDILVILPSSTGSDSLIGEGIIKVEPEKANEQTIIAF